MTLALDKLPTPECTAHAKDCDEHGFYVGLDFARSLEQRLAMAVGLLERLRPFAVGPHYADEYGNEIPPDLDTSPALLADLDAFLALLRETGR